MSDFVASVNNSKKNIFVSENSKIKVDGKSYNFKLEKLGEFSYLLICDEKFYEITAVQNNENKYSIVVNGSLFEIEIRTALQEKALILLEQKKSASRKLEIKAPMPGMILKVNKNPGDKVFSGEPIIILEAMKMENELRAPVSGIIKEIFVKESSSVDKGLKLFSIET